MKTRTMITVTQCVLGDTPLRYHRSIAAIPAARIAKAEALAGYDSRVVDPPSTRLSLRAPESYMWVAETVEEVAALANGETAAP